MVRNVPLAEDLTQETLLAAMEAWPAAGIPDHPGAWLMATAKRRAIDALRREKMLGRKHATLAQDMDAEQRIAPDYAAALDDAFGDEQLRLIFTACHPLLSREARVALTLKMLCGLTTQEIARAFLVAESTIAQRIVRAKRTLANSGLTYETPRGEAIAERMSSVLEVIYVIFNEGYAAASGDDWMRPQLCEDALRLGRILISIAPNAAEAHGLTSLMELNASRQAARTDDSGEPILLLEQNRALWDRAQIRRGVRALVRARALGGADGFYALQAAIAACHAQAATAAATDWAMIAALYARLAIVAPSPVIELNRAIAVAMTAGPQAGLAIVDAMKDDPAIARYHLVPSVRGDLLRRLGRDSEAQREFERAAALATNRRERDLLMRRAAEAERATNS